MRRVKTISMCLPEELVEELRHKAWCVGISVSSYTTMLLTQALRGPGEEVSADGETKS